MPKIPGVNHLDAVKALEKAGFRILRQGKHIVMSDGVRIVTIPRHNPVNAFTMGGIARDAGLSVEQFKNFSDNGAIQQIVGRERRERVSQLTWCGGGCFDSRRRVNSDVRLLF